MDFLVYINRFLVALVFSIFFGSGATMAGVEEDYVKAKQSFDSGDYKTAMAVWGPLGEEGHSRSQVMLGYAYKNGMGVVKNNKISFRNDNPEYGKRWLIKSQNHRGVRFFSGLDELENIMTTKDMVAKCIEPFLIGGHKFDVGTYMMN